MSRRIPVDTLPQREKIKVFWLQQKLYEDGLDGIHFRERMISYLQHEADDDMERQIDRELNIRV